MGDRNENSRERGQETDLIQFPARAIFDTREVPALVAGNKSEINLSDKDKCLAIIRAHCADPSVIEEDGSNVFIWAAEISSDRRDYYETVMDPETSLKNYVEDAIEGVSFMNSHSTWELPSGRSFAGALVSDQEGVTKVYAAFYTIADLNLSGLSTNDLMRGIRAGIVKDVSIGFKRGENFKAQCSICGLDQWSDWDCIHWPGVVYDVFNDDKKTTHEERCFVTLIDARLREVSGVYDGATPRAMVDKAISFAERGLIKESMFDTVERTLRMKLPHGTKFLDERNDSDESNTDRKGDDDMANDGDKNAPKVHDALLRMSRSLNLFPENNEPGSTEEITSKVSSEITRLRAIESSHDKYIKAERESALKEGVRALGEGFDEDRYKGILEKCDLDEVRGFREEWSKIADDKLKGGRRSVDDPDAEGDAEGDGDADAEGSGEASEDKSKKGAEDDETVERSLREFGPETSFR